MPMVLILKLGQRTFKLKNYLYYYTCEKLSVMLKHWFQFRELLAWNFNKFENQFDYVFKDNLKIGVGMKILKRRNCSFKN